MSEIEKLYANAEIEPIYPYTKCYPDFTSAKQLELIKFFANRKGYPDYGKFFGADFDYYAQFYYFDEALAKTVNTLWQDITDTEKAEIKRILED